MSCSAKKKKNVICTTPQLVPTKDPSSVFFFKASASHSVSNKGKDTRIRIPYFLRGEVEEAERPREKDGGEGGGFQKR